ncbi:hypothetical protein DRW41_04210 [Neobacillus piezotolerans]|uniref:Uncharacterized protein n=1 Tax=Neobacillus piezotolerans TaxID=2259171 RepID=A0A3D8GWE1_9BACI|nr:hypothetical protein [Neobacillus piezotolerans]RDU38770.1 hypothetical protein DRW41_04210 [Neobacillus piezotolerans]
MPFYVLHQPVIVGIGIFLADLGLGLGLKLPVLAVGAFAIIMAIYHFAVRRINILRLLLGMKGKQTGDTLFKPAAGRLENDWRWFRVWFVILKLIAGKGE